MFKENFLYFLSGIFVAFALNLLFFSFFYAGSRGSFSNVYVVDLKKIVDKLYTENLKKSNENPSLSDEYDKEFEMEIKKLSEVLNSYEFPVFVKGAVVNLKSDSVIDLTNSIYKQVLNKENR